MEITENDRAMVEEHLGVNLPEYLTSESWENLRDLRQQLREGSKNLLAKATAEERDLGAEEERASEIAIQFLEVISDEIEDRTIEGRRGPRLIDEPLRPLPTTQRSNNMKNIFEPRKTWRSIFGREPKAVQGIRDFGECIAALHGNDLGKLAELRTMNNAMGEQGGYSVDEVTWSQIWDAGYETSVVMDKLRYFPMTTNILLIPGWDSEDQSKGKVAGVTGAWIGEGLSASRVTPKMRLVTYTAHKLGIYIACTSEILQDSAAVASSLLPLMRSNLTSAVDEAVLNGSGVAEPMGILNSPAAISVTRSSAGTVTFSDLAGMMGRMLPSSLRRCVWICSPSAFSVLVGLQVGTNSGVLAMNNQTGATDFQMRILGAEVRISDKLSERGTRGDLVLADLGFYGFASRETGRFEKTAAAQWTSDIIDFRLILRCDGKPLIGSPITPAVGSTTLSPFIVLDA